jgi:general secretion pathway protein A
MVNYTKPIGYYSVLGFDQDPFSTSPNPQFFYPSPQHEAVLANLLIELRLRRGLSVVFGDVGTGKTTLCRKLLHELNKRGDIIFHMILNPAFHSEEHFLVSLIRNLNIDITDDSSLKDFSILELRDTIEKFLIQKTLEEDRTITLIIDEAQKLDLVTLETLRSLLNFETNDHKLIQLVLFGQLELYAKVVQMSNFFDRISFKYTLNPLDVDETRALINFRLQAAGYRGRKRLFLDEAVSEIYSHTKGYPRKINMFCHKLLKELVMKGVDIVDLEFVKEVIVQERMASPTEL